VKLIERLESAATRFEKKIADWRIIGPSISCDMQNESVHLTVSPH